MPNSPPPDLTTIHPDAWQALHQWIGAWGQANENTQIAAIIGLVMMTLMICATVAFVKWVASRGHSNGDIAAAMTPLVGAITAIVEEHARQSEAIAHAQENNNRILMDLQRTIQVLVEMGGCRFERREHTP